MDSLRTVDVPRAPRGELDPAARRARRRALDALRALEALGVPCAYRVVAADGAEVPASEITDEDSAEVRADLRQLDHKAPLALAALVDRLYAASACSDRSRVASALDDALDYVDHFCASSPERVDALFEQLDPSKLVRAVGQTLLAATRLDGRPSSARTAFLARFLADQRARGTPAETVARLERGLSE